ncbi:hypothetical protein TorRG33x02_225630 [Trema orientale]|uniref:Uncharacterized protein n=1 Tax=Trema orientale TaxID=63057 RepID=A0A2P5E847_TREOI|nr:hypothetical protein TorRG33x02_225630 [Trema orientale]
MALRQILFNNTTISAPFTNPHMGFARFFSSKSITYEGVWRVCSFTFKRFGGCGLERVGRRCGRGNDAATPYFQTQKPHKRELEASENRKPLKL